MKAEQRTKLFNWIKNKFGNSNRMQVFKFTWNELEDILHEYSDQKLPRDPETFEVLEEPNLDEIKNKLLGIEDLEFKVNEVKKNYEKALKKAVYLSDKEVIEKLLKVKAKYDDLQKPFSQRVYIPKLEERIKELEEENRILKGAMLNK